MGKRAPRRPDRAAPHAPTIIHVVGARPEDPLGLTLRRAFGGARFFPGPSAPHDETAALAVGIFAAGDTLGPRAFAERARAARVPALSVGLREDEALVGPLALPDRAGCGRCAFERMTAAAASALGPQAARAPASHAVGRVAGRVLVREVRAIIHRGPEHSHLLGHVLAVDAGTGDESLHKVIPLPRCAVCGGAAAFPAEAQEATRLSPEDSLEVVFGALAGWVDQRTGVISNCYLEPPGETGVSLPLIVTAAPPHVMEGDGSLRRLPLGWGKGLTVSGALLSAVGEAVERYAASLPDSGRVVWKRPADLDREFLDPRDCALYTDAQYGREDFPYARFDPDVRHPWVLGEWLGGGRAVWVPAVFAFLSLTLEPRQLICQGSSNGLAASTDREDAALRATLELVERDAFMAAWLAARAGRRVELDDTLDPLLRLVLDGVRDLGAAVEVYALPTSVCGTTVLCLGLGDGDEYPGATIGLGTDLDPRAALRQAVLELGQTGPHLRRLMRSNALPTPDAPASVREMLDHAAYYFPRERAAAFDRLRRGGGAPVRLRDLVDVAPTRSLAACASELEAAGVRVALVDVTSADVATGPFRVVRAVSPDLQPISYGYGLEREPVERIRIQNPDSAVPPIHPIW